MMTLDIAIATHKAEGIGRTARMLLPPQDGVRYVVSWQASGNCPLPDALRRPDVVVSRFDGAQGVAPNRNNAFDLCEADIILMADDDLQYLPGAFDAIRRTFEEHPEVDMATFRSVFDTPPEYPRESVKLRRKLPKNYYFCTREIALRRSTAGRLRCCPELGIGAPRYQSGEDELLPYTAIRRGFHCQFFPIDICVHDHKSTGTKHNPTAGNITGTGCCIALMNPLTWPARIPLKALRMKRAGQSGFWRALFHLYTGAAGAPFVYFRNLKYLK